MRITLDNKILKEMILDLQAPHICSYEDVLKHLNLTKSNDRYIMSRPVKDYNTKTVIQLQMVVYAILDVKETDQTFISYIWIYMVWNNEYIQWNKSEFCEIPYIEVPAESLWKPDLTIEEMVENDKAPPVPYLCIYHNNEVELRNDQVVVSTCRMHVYKFPFDIQSCNLSFKSVLYPDDELTITVKEDSKQLTDWSEKIMDSQYEWLFLNMSVTNDTVSYFGFNQTLIVYTVKMKRRSILYVANFLLPVLFFLFLDFASLLMSNSSGEKIGFKITVLLAVTVMQLILNDILPASSNRIPIIGQTRNCNFTSKLVHEARMLCIAHS
ncbi:5-hydroxytryptamine receptor 3A-like [Nothobranchius furzeri]|uniref:5-hydroxytryptamine receptor 3A-like n=1 Tax=Nothobranchius furzeri TaxID=105023 RepID=A0A9D2XL17_NOTFU|nr:5-hydroxytryptamine receptor 3A-like [Nothobranchius furzeri]